MRQLIRTRSHGEENGASAVEYGLLIVGIAALLVLVVFALGGVTRGIFSKTCSSVQTRASVSSCS